jgi:hypothetical protein
MNANYLHDLVDNRNDKEKYTSENILSIISYRNALLRYLLDPDKHIKNSNRVKMFNDVLLCDSWIMSAMIVKYMPHQLEIT